TYTGRPFASELESVRARGRQDPPAHLPSESRAVARVHEGRSLDHGDRKTRARVLPARWTAHEPRRWRLPPTVRATKHDRLRPTDGLGRAGRQELRRHLERPRR